MDYDTYIAEFNKGDDAALVERFFAEDVRFQSGPRVLNGARALLDFLHWAHDGIREIIRAQLVMQEGNHLFAEIDMDFHATRDRPDFTFGALGKGETTTVKFFVVYTLREDGKIVHLKASTWPPKVGVTPPGTLP
jgi:SnoaL-like domain